VLAAGRFKLRHFRVWGEEKRRRGDEETREGAREGDGID
jgi:hypothetical protein